ncbi:unnamed protein product [Nezara viridula]|uniref:GH18 domain-containing protein n=1 Tax=Nezara viridula TaxID=85310 RepID=A0A9P0HJI7_NEZVI|nr:unnamed protein product [Nezara viridula]
MEAFLKLCFCFLTVLLFNVDFIEGKKPVVTCYVAAWAVNRGKWNISEADTKHCTHIIYAYMGMNENTSEIMNVDPLIDLEEEGKGKAQLKQLTELKKANPDLKILASVGGWLQGSVKFSEMARTSSKSTTFINSLIKFIRQWELDGIDICWQFPGQRGGKPEDRKNFVNLLKDIKKTFVPEGWLLTVHIIAHRDKIRLGYDVKSISDAVDYINLAAVEYNGPWMRNTGIMAPLNSTDGNNVIASLDYVLQRGANSSKILLGLPTYGHAYITDDKIEIEKKYIGLPSDHAFPSPWTQEPGIIAYNEICFNLKNDKNWKEGFDKNSSTPFAYVDKIFVSFDNKRSLIEKAKLVISRRLGGMMLWSLDMDDFQGVCHNESYPMLSAVTDFLISEEEKIEKTLLGTEPSESEDKQEHITIAPESANEGGNQIKKVQTVNIITIELDLFISKLYHCLEFLQKQITRNKS